MERMLLSSTSTEWPPSQVPQSHEVREKYSLADDNYFKVKINHNKVILLMRSI